MNIVCPHCDSINRVPRDKPALAANCGKCHRQLFTGQPIQVTAKSFDTHVKYNDIPVVIDFWAEWCGPCKMMEPEYQRAAKELEPEFRFLKVDTEAETELASRYNIRSIPTVMILLRGKVVAQRAGALNASMLRSWLKDTLKAAAA